MRYFLAVADTGSFTRAAEASFVAQSALSQQIARLEAELETPLFTRTSRSVRLTPAGEVLVPLARRILLDVQVARDEIDALDGLRHGRLRLGLIQSEATSIDTVQVMGEFHQLYPGIGLAVTYQTSSAMVNAVVRGELDLAVIGLDASELPDGVGRRLLASDPLVGVVSRGHDVDEARPIDVAALVDLGQFIHFASGTGLRRHVDAAFDRAGVPRQSDFEVGQIGDMIRLAGLGVGVAIVPRSSMNKGEHASSASQVKVLSLRDDLAVHPVSVVFDPVHPSPSTRAFLELMTKHC
ncbi:LysR family transcriptional regulator [Frondihabitans cladoniiphilus]|uniref:LysR family transcriptional regulator n=1 Tax=Frondihabitans cladoniiphilus TaxID=715785 RepID=A0ABP8W6U0_9MICO